MTTPHLLLLVAVSVVAMISIVNDHKGAVRTQYYFKPLPVLLLLPVVLSALHVPGVIQACFVIGLLLSCVGDVLLIDRQRFVYGLASFLLAHIAYLTGLWLSLSDIPRVTYLLPLTLWGGLLFWRVRQGLDDVELPVLIYISVIMVMVWLAVEQYNQTQSLGALLMLIGATVFALSDTVLALERFRGPFKASGAIVLSTYYLAQTCIAFSLVYLA